MSRAGEVENEEILQRVDPLGYVAPYEAYFYTRIKKHSYLCKVISKNYIQIIVCVSLAMITLYQSQNISINSQPCEQHEQSAKK